MEQLNVCLLNDSFPPAIDGVANAVTNYARIISQEHGRATVVTPFYPDADDSVFPFPVLRYPSLDTTKLVGYRAGVPFAPELMDELGRRDFDLIHSHCPIVSTMLARALREQINRPVVFTYHTKFDIDIANAIRSKLLQEGAAAILDRFARKGFLYPENLERLRRCGELAEKKGMSVPQLALRWIFQQGLNVFAAVSCSREERIGQNAEALDYPLSDGEAAWLDLRT